SFAAIDRLHYNRIMTEETERIRDFLIAHYHITARDDTPFWNYCRNMTVPERLAEKIELFKNNGRTFRENEELFTSTSWFAVLMGQGLKPGSYDRVVDALSFAETKKRVDELQQVVINS